MTAGYSPVTSPGGANHYSLSAYVGDGTTSLHAGVLAYDCQFRDILVLQGAGVADGHYADGEIALAYGPTGAWCTSTERGRGGGRHRRLAQIIANAASGIPTAPAVLYAPSWTTTRRTGRRSGPTPRAGQLLDARTGTPSAALLATYDGVYTHSGQVYSARVLFGDLLATSWTRATRSCSAPAPCTTISWRASTTRSAGGSAPRGTRP